MEQQPIGVVQVQVQKALDVGVDVDVDVVEDRREAVMVVVVVGMFLASLLIVMSDGKNAGMWRFSIEGFGYQLLSAFHVL